MVVSMEQSPEVKLASPDAVSSRSKKGIQWHEGENFLHEFDDSHLWLHGKIIIVVVHFSPSYMAVLMELRFLVHKQT